jgi:hypothetical protein
MSSRTRCRPGWGAMLLVFCVAALGSHFIGESLTHAATPAPDSLHPGCDLAEDQFVLASALAPSAESGSLWGASPLLHSVALASLAPPVPPPDL